MFPDEILALADSLSLSTGELLGLARRIAQNGALRTIDKLTQEQQTELLYELRWLKSSRGWKHIDTWIRPAA